MTFQRFGDVQSRAEEVHNECWQAFDVAAVWHTQAQVQARESIKLIPQTDIKKFTGIKNRGQGLGGGPARKQFEADDVEADDFNAMLSVIPNGTGSFFRFK